MSGSPLGSGRPPIAGAEIAARYAAPPKADPRETPEIASRCYSAHATQLTMLDLRLLSGGRHGLPYHYLEEVTMPSEDLLELVFLKKKVRVTGMRLEPIYQALLGHRVGYLMEADPRFSEDTQDPAAQNAPFIREIEPRESDRD
ncbi:MAG: hypothetical protein AAF711_01100 [Planctomycetota bacterium]